MKLIWKRGPKIAEMVFWGFWADLFVAPPSALRTWPSIGRDYEIECQSQPSQSPSTGKNLRPAIVACA
jgi:hypothetical protein